MRGKSNKWSLEVLFARHVLETSHKTRMENVPDTDAFLRVRARE